MGYHPSLGRFAQRDSGPEGGLPSQIVGVAEAGPSERPTQQGIDPEYEDGMNLYRYAKANPTFMTDPLGLQGLDRYSVGTSAPVIVDRLNPPDTSWVAGAMETLNNTFLNGAQEALTLAGHWASPNSATPITEYGGGRWAEFFKGQATVREGSRELLREAAKEAWDGEPSSGSFSKEKVLLLPRGLWTTGTINGFTYAVSGTYWVDKVSSCSVTLMYPYHRISDTMDAHAEAIFPDIPMIALNYISANRFQWFGLQVEWTGESVEFHMNPNGEIQSVRGGWPWGS